MSEAALTVGSVLKSPGSCGLVPCYEERPLVEIEQWKSEEVSRLFVSNE